MSNNLTKRDIVLDIYDKTEFPQKEVRETVQRTLDAIAQALAEGRNVELRNFGVFDYFRYLLTIPPIPVFCCRYLARSYKL